MTIAYRIILGAYTAAMNESQQSSLIVIGVSLLFLVYNLVNLPFEKAYHNYRANICHFTQFVTLFIAMYYRSMRSNSPPSSVALVFTPAQLEIVCIVLSLVVSMVVLGYEIYLFVKEFIGEHFKVKKHSPRNGLIN